MCLWAVKDLSIENKNLPWVQSTHNRLLPKGFEHYFSHPSPLVSWKDSMQI